MPQKHWFALGRLLTSHGGDLSLISWSGSMFEYLMPQLFLPSYENTLLEQACQAAVSRQIEYGRQRHVPWGISESCYNAVDMNQVYQYRAFGVPGLGFKRGLADDLVIAPYATALALTVVPREACRNLQTLAAAAFSAPTGSTRRSTTRRRALLPGHEPRRRTLLHGASPGDESAGHRACVARSAHAAPVHLRPAGPHHRIAAAGTHPQADRDRAPARRRVVRGRPPAAEEAGCRPPRPHRPEHAAARGPPAVQRQLPRHGHPRGRRLQSLARPGRHPLARGRDLRRPRHLHLPARSQDRPLLVDRLSNPRAARPSATRRSSCRDAPNTAGSTTRSKHTPRSASRRKTTSRSAASRSPTSPTRRARSR